MNLELLVHNIGFLGGALINLILIVFVLRAKREKIDTATLTFILMTLSVMTFQVSHVFGIMAMNASTSRLIFMFNLANIPIAIFMTHWFLALSGQTNKHHLGLGIVYVTGIALLIFYILFPQTFLIDSVPKMYFPFYYNPGKLQIVMRLWFNVAGIYFFYIMGKAYWSTTDPIERNRYKYTFYSILYGFFTGSTAILLVYNIQFDPIWAALFFGLYTIPLAYAMVRYELLDIRILAKRAFLYASVIAFVALIITFINFLIDYIHQINPAFPNWVGHFLTSIIISSLGIFIWSKLREADVLKYEFVNIITHKFRTPLSRIRWSTDDLVTTNHFKGGSMDDIHAIRASNSQLIELTNTLATLNDSEATNHINHFKVFSLAELVDETVSGYALAFREKRITVDFPKNLSKNVREAHINADPGKISFVLQILLDNALIYTKPDGILKLNLEQNGKNIEFSITDNGIGISKNNLGYIFNKFYRANNARATDTEGTGIGLYMAKQIVERNGGKISADSAGEGQGATFTVSFPLDSTRLA